MKVAFQGELGANGHIASKTMFPEAAYVPKRAFEEVFEAVASGEVDRGIIYIENSIIGRIADIYRLLPSSDLKIVAEYFVPVHHQLLGVPGATLADIKTVTSMAPALAQCRKIVKELGVETRDAYDTAGSAKIVSEQGDKTVAAIAPRLAAEIYGLTILKENIEDAPENATRCLALAKEMEVPAPGVSALTTCMFTVKNIPAALYKALGCFATNGLNLTKIESYQLNGSFLSTRFYIDIEGNINDEALKRAFAGLSEFASDIKIVGCYPKDASRRPSS